MSLTRLAVFRPVVALTVTLALVLFGIASYTSLGLEQNPQLELPIVTVQVTYPGASARTVEEQVARRIEDAVAGLGNIKTLTSVSRNGLATVTVEFNEGIDVDTAASDVERRVSGVRRDLPAEAEEPSFVKLDLNDVPVLYLAVTSVVRRPGPDVPGGGRRGAATTGDGGGRRPDRRGGRAASRRSRSRSSRTSCGRTA